MDEDQLYLRPGNPARYEERHPTGSELELIMWQIAKLRRDLLRAVVWAGLAARPAAPRLGAGEHARR